MFVSISTTLASVCLHHKKRNPMLSKGFLWNHTDLALLKDFFDKIPKAPGHYCRKDSRKIYLNSGIKTMAKLHDAYKTWCQGSKHFFFRLQSSMSIFMKIIFHFLRGKNTTAIRVLHTRQGTPSKQNLTCITSSD